MEKIITVSGMTLKNSYFNEVNEYLQNGWSVKSINTVATNSEMTAVIVLEKLKK